MLIPIPVRRRARRQNPTVSAGVFAIIGAALLVFGFMALAMGAECDGKEMQEGDACIYKDANTGQVDHTKTAAEEKKDDELWGWIMVGVGAAFVIGSPFAYAGAQRNNARLAAAQRRASAPPRQPPVSPMQSAYAQQVASFRMGGAGAAVPPPPVPPAAYPPPTAHPPRQPPAPPLHHEI